MTEDLKAYTKWLLRWAAGIYFVVVLIGKLPLGRDDSDPSEWGKRSGIAVRKDALTGCEYLESMHGGLTPRLDRAGHHVGCR